MKNYYARRAIGTTLFFHGGYAIHGSHSVPAYNASHGCVRVLPTHAKWLSKNFMRNGTRVIVLPY